MGYDAVQYFEEVEFHNPSDFDIPEVIYRVYRYVIGIDHFKNQMHIFEHRLESDDNSELDQLITLIDNKNFSDYYFKSDGEEVSNYTDDEFLDIISKGRQHCLRGDVFQIVLSRRFQTKYSGDDFNVYRALRSINPSPYLFYFDYGNFRVFGSSPEAQIVIKDQKAVIHPIAGTFARTGNDQADSELAQKLFTDTKENSEHVMLVDLARNDLSRNSSQVQVDTFKEIQYFSHVIHLVSKVSGELTGETSPGLVVADTFPAGTLSGAPKHMAMTLIDKYENAARGYYGGAIGFMGFNGDFNHAIMIRSFLSENGTLYYQAGAGVVAKSVIESELQEVNNKTGSFKTGDGISPGNLETAMKILVLDNYDSFTYNLVHILRELGYGPKMEVFRNDKIALENVNDYDKILLSPGPGIPEEAGIMLDLIENYGSNKSILGICLGHQGDCRSIWGFTLQYE